MEVDPRDSPSANERPVILRKERQRRFTEGRLKLWAIVEETALRRPIGEAPRSCVTSSATCSA